MDDLDSRQGKPCHQSCKHHKRLSREYDRPGRDSKIEKKYRSGSSHSGKGKTLRSHRKS